MLYILGVLEDTDMHSPHMMSHYSIIEEQSLGEGNYNTEDVG